MADEQFTSVEITVDHRLLLVGKQKQIDKPFLIDPNLFNHRHIHPFFMQR